MLSFGVVLLTMGDRPEQLRAVVEAVRRQRGVEVDVVVVVNGGGAAVPDGARPVVLETNVGVPAGRNIGAAHADGEVLAFLDDDLVLDRDDLFAEVARRFGADRRLGVLQPRAVDPVTGATARRHVPRLRAGDPERAGDVAWFWEGCSFVRREAFAAAGGWPAGFFYGHEGVELAWRVVDAGWRIRYAADLTVGNPPAEPFRRPGQQVQNMRNRVWVARRNLPHPFLELYLLVWTSATLVRARSLAHAAAALRGFAAGWREPAGERRPIRWRTVWRLTRLGRPPVV